MRIAIIALALLAAGAAAAASPPGGHSGRGDKDGWGDRGHRPDRWDFGRHGWGFVRPCPGQLTFGSCRRHARDFYPWPYAIVLPPTGNRYLSDDWPFYGWGYDPALVDPVSIYPAGGKAPFALPGLAACPDGVQRCHEDEWTVADEEPQ